MAAPEQQARRAERGKRRLPIAFAGMFSAIVVGFGVVAVVLWLVTR